MKLIRACLLVTLSMGTFASAHAACNAGAVSCMTGPGAGQKQCTRTVMCSATASGSGMIFSTSPMGPVSCSGGGGFAGGSPLTDTLVATALSPDTYHKCSWTWSSFTNAMPAGFGIIRIDTGDGLPVELMEFSIPGSD